MPETVRRARNKSAPKKTARTKHQSEPARAPAVQSKGNDLKAGPPPDAKSMVIPPTRIRANPLNPRMRFDDAKIEALAESITKIGVLVPVTVYPDTAADGTTHVLLDGERRWRASKLINAESIPAWVIPKPDGVENVLRMFNIHMLREDWDQIVTTWALGNLMKELGIDDVEILRQRTGLSADSVRNMKRVLQMPKEYQQAVADGKISFHYLVELDKDVLTKLRRDPEAHPGLKEKAVRDALVKKHLTGVTPDPVSLRKVGHLMTTARLPGVVGQRADSALRELLGDPQMTVDEAYSVGAAASVELRGVLRDMADLPQRIAYLAESDLASPQRRELVKALRLLQNKLKTVAKALS